MPNKTDEYCVNRYCKAARIPYKRRVNCRDFNKLIDAISDLVNQRRKAHDVIPFNDIGRVFLKYLDSTDLSIGGKLIVDMIGSASQIRC